MVLPFITRLLVYDAGLSRYSWYSDSKITSDFFTYYKSYAFIFLSIITALILLPYLLVKQGQTKDRMPFILIGIYSLFCLLSTVFSINMHASMVGGMTHFESIFVLMGYAIMLIYIYQIEKSNYDYICILRVLEFTLALLCIIGFFQMIGKDLLYHTWIQKLIIPKEYWKNFLGKLKFSNNRNAVSLTLFNPNYASVYLAMVIPFLLALIVPTEVNQNNVNDSYRLGKKEKSCCIILSILLLILLFKTYSRSGLIAFLISLIFLAYFYRKQLRRYLIYCIIAGTSCVLLFIGIDCLNHFKYINKITGTFQSLQDDDSDKLQDILTNQDDVTIKYKDSVISFSFAADSSQKDKLVFKNAKGKDISGFYNNRSKCLNYNQFGKMKIYAKVFGNNRAILCQFQNITWRFVLHEDNGYTYINDFGKEDKLRKIEHIGSQSLEDIGSGRGYIWSRSIPLLKNTLLLGKGPDTFLYVFPQSDYVGKANNCKTAYTLIEKPHSLYLMTAIQTGVISLIALLAFYLIYMISSIRIYKKHDLSTLQSQIGVGCFVATVSFMISGFFNDSSLQTTPFFIVMLGLGMDINYKMSR